MEELGGLDKGGWTKEEQGECEKHRLFFFTHHGMGEDGGHAQWVSYVPMGKRLFFFHPVVFVSKTLFLPSAFFL